jgi:hypothetical protein
VNDPKPTDDTQKPDAQGSGFSQDTPSRTDEKLPENSQKSLNRKLDEALEETFPTSDPVSVKITK